MTKNNTQNPDLNAVADALDNPVIMDELRDLLDTLSEREFDELKKSIETEGIRDPLVIWKEKNAVVDGHNRLRIAKLLELPEKDIPKVNRSFKDVHEVKQWMIQNQLGRRNLTPQRFDYFVGKLYNEMRQDPKKQRTDQGGDTTANIIGGQFGVSERSVRRRADEAKAVDMLERVSGKLAKIKHLSGQGEYSKQELGEIAKTKSSTAAKKVIDKIDQTKKAKEEAKKQAKEQKKEPAVSLYPVAFITPDYDRIGFSITTETKPPLEKDAIVYLMAPDEHLADALKMLDRWGLTYECSFVFKINPYEGVWSKVSHTFLLTATKGTVTGPKAGNEAPSIGNGGDAYENMVKLINAYHKGSNKLAMVGSNATPQGWSTLKK